jgi:hypothetical protein
MPTRIAFKLGRPTERDAVAAAEAVKGLRIRRQGLQTSLQTASPAAKPAIIDQIQHLSAVETPAAEAAVEQAKAALQTCLDRFGTHCTFERAQ